MLSNLNLHMDIIEDWDTVKVLAKGAKRCYTFNKNESMKILYNLTMNDNDGVYEWVYNIKRECFAFDERRAYYVEFRKKKFILAVIDKQFVMLAGGAFLNNHLTMIAKILHDVSWRQGFFDAFILANVTSINNRPVRLYV